MAPVKPVVSCNRTAFQYGTIVAGSGDVYQKLVNGVLMSATRGIPMARAGSIISHACQVNITTATSGNVTMKIQKNGTDLTGSDLELAFLSGGGTGVKIQTATIPRGQQKFSAGDFISVRADETGVMIWDNTIGYFEVQFDT